MVSCNKCGKQNPDTAKFCTGCGTIFTSAKNPLTESKYKKEDIINRKKPGKSWRRLAGGIIGIGLGFAIYFLFIRKGDPEKTGVLAKTEKNANDNTENGNSIENSTDISEKEIMTFLDEWLKAQNSKNMASYASFYDPTFKGIKRVKDGRVFYYNHDEWINDRTKMYTAARNLAVTATNVRISDNTGETTRILFTSGYSSSAYTDMGEKELLIKKNNSGAFTILKEEMLNSDKLSSPNIDTSDLLTFWEEFKSAVISDDYNKISQLTYFPFLQQNKYIYADDFKMFRFETGYVNAIKKTANPVKSNMFFGGGMDINGNPVTVTFKEGTLFEVNMNDGPAIYFAKVNGVFRFIAILYGE